MNLHVPQWERFGPDTNSKTDNNQTDGETDGQGDSYVAYTPKLCQGGYNDKILLHNWVIMKRCLLIYTEIITKVTRKYHEERD